MLNGLCADCPCCGMAALHFASGRIACVGSVGGLARCPYRAKTEDVSRFRFELPKEVSEADWLAEWRSPAAAAPAAGGKGGKKRKQPDPPGPALAHAGSRALRGLSLAARKAINLDSLPDAIPPPPARAVPEEGCPLLEVHRGFKQTGEFHRARVLVADDGASRCSRGAVVYLRRPRQPCPAIAHPRGCSSAAAAQSAVLCSAAGGYICSTAAAVAAAASPGARPRCCCLHGQARALAHGLTLPARRAHPPPPPPLPLGVR